MNPRPLSALTAVGIVLAGCSGGSSSTLPGGGSGSATLSTALVDGPFRTTSGAISRTVTNNADAAVSNAEVDAEQGSAIINSGSRTATATSNRSSANGNLRRRHRRCDGPLRRGDRGTDCLERFDQRLRTRARFVRHRVDAGSNQRVDAVTIGDLVRPSKWRAVKRSGRASKPAFTRCVCESGAGE